MAEAAERGREIVAQLSPAMCLGPQKAAFLQQAVGEILELGTIIGQVRGLSYRANLQDESTPSIALVGPFKFIPFAADRDEIWATRAFLPKSVHDTIVQSLEGDNKRPVDKAPKRGQAIGIDLGFTVPVVIEIGVKRDDSAVGYQYVTHGSKKVPLQLADPLADLSEKAGVKTLPAPELGGKVVATKTAKKKKK